MKEASCSMSTSTTFVGGGWSSFLSNLGSVVWVLQLSLPLFAVISISRSEKFPTDGIKCSSEIEFGLIFWVNIEEVDILVLNMVLTKWVVSYDLDSLKAKDERERRGRRCDPAYTLQHSSQILKVICTLRSEWIFKKKIKVGNQTYSL